MYSTALLAVWYMPHVISMILLIWNICLQCFDTVGWPSGRASGRKMERWGTGVVICLGQGANDLHMVQLMPLPPHHLCFD